MGGVHLADLLAAGCQAREQAGHCGSIVRGAFGRSFQQAVGVWGLGSRSCISLLALLANGLGGRGELGAAVGDYACGLPAGQLTPLLPLPGCVGAD